MASSASEPAWARRLRAAQLEPVGWLRASSNQALLVRLDGDADALAVYKPDAGERPLWDFPAGTLARREAAAYELSSWLGWELVPATVYRHDGPAGPGSIQRFVAHDPRRHYFALRDEGTHDEALLRMATFDVLANNADRKASHVMLAEDGRILGCDHGLCFHAEPKLRTVIWDFAGASLPAALCERVRALAGALAAGPAGDSLGGAMGGLLAGAELSALERRARLLLAAPSLPDPPEDRRPYPWPLL